jgi:hypothetical protein
LRRLAEKNAHEQAEEIEFNEPLRRCAIAVPQPGERFQTYDKIASEAHFAALSSGYREARHITGWQMAVIILSVVSSLATGYFRDRTEESHPLIAERLHVRDVPIHSALGTHI